MIACICTKSPLSHTVIHVDGVDKQSKWTLLCILVVGNVLPVMSGELRWYDYRSNHVMSGELRWYGYRSNHVMSGELRWYGYRSNLGSCQICINVWSTRNLAPVHWYLFSVACGDDRPITHPYVMA